MPLRPPEFEITNPGEPFEKDLLNRKPRVEALTRVIVAEEGPAVISVNGGFGAGKTSFLKMLAANLRLHDGVDVQEFNAWQQSYTEDPLIDLVVNSARSSVSLMTSSAASCRSQNGHISIVATSKGSRTRIATASVR